MDDGTAFGEVLGRIHPLFLPKRAGTETPKPLSAVFSGALLGFDRTLRTGPWCLHWFGAKRTCFGCAQVLPSILWGGCWVVFLVGLP